jgi:DNA-binding transcriptional LysR family regulator
LVASGQLIPVLAGHFEKPSIPIYAVMLQERHRLPKIRACIDYWAEWVGKMR